MLNRKYLLFLIIACVVLIPCLVYAAEEAKVPQFGTPTPEARAVKDGIALVASSNTRLDPKTGLLCPVFKMDLDAIKSLPVSNKQNEIGDLLRKWYKEGTAAGNVGDMYDNRDNKHAVLNKDIAPQITYVEYDDEAKKLQLGHWLPFRIKFDGPVIGNASLALTSGPDWRSAVRAAVHDPAYIRRLTMDYYDNKFYVYPCHVDNTPGHNGSGGGYGDVYAVNTPYLICSQGSSGSDQPALQAVAQSLAAFRPDVKSFLIEKDALAPTLQYLYRACNTAVKTPADYLTGAAHPNVFDGNKIDTAKMVQTAHDMKKSCVPPVVMIEVVDEDEPPSVASLFPDGKVRSDKFFDSPCAISRIWYSTSYTKSMTVSAAGSQDLNGLPLTYKWVVLRGDERAISIKTTNARGSLAQITISYTPRRPVSPDSQLESNRVDIGVFAYNGTYYSAPAFICFYTLDNEDRTYSMDGRLQSIDYNGNYVDTVLFPSFTGRDEFHYGADNKLTGWIRRNSTGTVQEYDAQGSVVSK